MIFSSIIRLFCKHQKTNVRTAGNHMFTVCIKCGHRSEGIVTGWHQYSKETTKRLRRTEIMSKAQVA